MTYVFSGFFEVFQNSFSAEHMRRSSCPKVFPKRRCLKKLHKNHRKAPVLEYFFKKAAVWSLRFYLKRTLAQGFSGEFCEIFKNTFFIEYLRWLLLSVNDYFCTYKTEKNCNILIRLLFVFICLLPLFVTLFHCSCFFV